MNWEDSNFITLKDLGIAYRKAKADLYYENGHANAFAVCEYETNLRFNLEALYSKLRRDSLKWMIRPEFVGDWSVIPKRIPDDRRENGPRLIWSDPDKAWRARIKAGEPEKPNAEFRLVGVHSIDFHVVSALWMLKVGHVYDSALGAEAYGTRLRRYHSRDSENAPAKLNPLSIGTFKHYFEPYRQWRDKGLSVMRKALDEGKRVVAITADVKQFYHRTSPDFLLNDKYINEFDLAEKIGGDARRFTRALIEAIHAWARQTPLHRDDPSVGIPVGLPAARLIANVALAELDKAIRRELIPLYYGRYVDDILLVIEDTREFLDDAAVWDFIVQRIGVLRADESDKRQLRFERKYLGNSEIVFAGDKQKVFLLEGATGKTLVETIERQIRARSSEWRALPDIPEREDALAADLISAVGDDGEEVDNLRKADGLSTRRAAFAIRLRDMEAFEQDLPSETWADQRRAFFKAIISNVLALPKLFEFASYLPRLLGLAVACRDYADAKALVDRLVKVIEMLQDDCRIGLGGQEEMRAADRRQVLRRWRSNLARALSESLAAALGPQHANDSAQLDELLETLTRLETCPLRDGEAALNWGQRLFVHDLGRVPFRRQYFPNEKDGLWTRDNKAQIPSEARRSLFLDKTIVTGVASCVKRLASNESPSTKLPLALLFPTRPFSVPELYLLVPDLLSREGKSTIKDWTLAFRGFKPQGRLPGATKDDSVAIPWDERRKTVRIVLTSWGTKADSWAASATQRNDPDAKRYRRLNCLLNTVLKCGEKPRYVVLPELSVPSRWFLRIATKLANCGISLVAGVEYIHHTHHGTKAVANQVWASLVSDFLGFPSLVIYCQDKWQAALHEEAELWKTAGLRLEPFAEKQLKPVLSHAGFRFGILICSELTNIEYRKDLRGKVDAVFVPEWNPDADTFSGLVESSALDIHAYIVQCNDRAYGDSRIRAPAKESWQRDIIRVKGGLEDYFVVGEIDVVGLRRFQSAHRSNAQGPFKPVPDGFIIDPPRKTRP